MASFLQVCRSVKARPSCIGFIFSRSRYSYVRRTSSSRHFPCNYSQQHAHNSWLVLLSIRDSSLLSRHPPLRSPAEKFLLTDKRHNRVEEKPIFRSSALPAKHHPSKRISWLPIQFTARGGSIYPRWWSPSPRNPWNFHSSTPLSLPLHVRRTRVPLGNFGRRIIGRKEEEGGRILKFRIWKNWRITFKKAKLGFDSFPDLETAGLRARSIAQHRSESAAWAR